MTDPTGKPPGGSPIPIEWTWEKGGFAVEGGRRLPFLGCVAGEAVWIHAAGRTWRLPLSEPERAAQAEARGEGVTGRLPAPIPGVVLEVHASPGERVEAGARLVTIEAMKMEHVLRAPAAARVRSVKVRPGDRVEAGQILCELEPAGGSGSQSARGGTP